MRCNKRTRRLQAEALTKSIECIDMQYWQMYMPCVLFQIQSVFPLLYARYLHLRRVMIICLLTRVSIVALGALVLLKHYCHCLQTAVDVQSFSIANCRTIQQENACNCSYDAFYESALIGCRSADERTELEISIYLKSDVDVTCRHVGAASAVRDAIPDELVARLPRLGSIRQAAFLSIHECMPFTPLLTRLALTRGKILHVHGLGRYTHLTAQNFGHNTSYLYSIVELELLAQPRVPQATQRLAADLFTVFPNLHTLKIELNITQLDIAVFIPLAATLNDFTLNARLRAFPTVALSPLRQLRVLYLMRQQFADRLCADDLAAFSLLEELSFHSCEISRLPARMLAPLPALKKLQLAKNELRVLPAALLVVNAHLDYLDLSDNLLESLPRTLFHPATNLTRLVLKNNRFAQLSAQMLPPLSALKWLRLENNLIHTIVANTFANAKHLQLLMLNSNRLNWTSETEACDVFAGMSSLQILNLQNNTLQRICDQLAAPNHSTSKLYELDLRYNKFTHLSAQLLHTLNSSKSFRELYLSHNPWTCDCGAQALHTFVKQQRQRQRLRDILELRCADAQLAPLVELSYHDFCLPDLGVNARFVLGFISLSALSLTLIITALCYYKYKLQLQVWLYARQLCLCCISEAELDRERKYDAFISYAHQDEHFVEHELLPGLEQGTPPFQVCIHARDWLAGGFITEQIIDSVEQSRRTLIVLSESFIASHWARMEFRMAHQCALNEGRSRIILVIYGDLVNFDLLDQELRAYLKMNTYLKWGEPWFWEKLRYAMPHPAGARSARVRQRSDEIPLQEFS
ncbi:toll-like receptor 4 [Zeugodacus cucurbitae]|uniref:toll-like receptor 4 n=1 Tax=Zeugodacus cucurbitae TaxID=28588 RepID=UPI0023D8F812|nr:toll-like receptor 4 [Zeugodacus cucurbitae]